MPGQNGDFSVRVFWSTIYVCSVCTYNAHKLMYISYLFFSFLSFSFSFYFSLATKDTKSIRILAHNTLYTFQLRIHNKFIRQLVQKEVN